MLQAIRKWLAIRSYARRLGPRLRKRYGRRKTYTPAQVKRTAEDGRYDLLYLCYALCMYCDGASFAEYHRTTGESCDYNTMRAEIPDRYHDGDASFDASDVIEHGDGGDDSSDAGGGDSGGAD